MSLTWIRLYLDKQKSEVLSECFLFILVLTLFFSRDYTLVQLRTLRTCVLAPWKWELQQKNYLLQLILLQTAKPTCSFDKDLPQSPSLDLILLFSLSFTLSISRFSLLFLEMPMQDTSLTLKPFPLMSIQCLLLFFSILSLNVILQKFFLDHPN